MKEIDIQLIKEDVTPKYGYTDFEMKLLLKKPDIKTCDFSEYRNWVITNYFGRYRKQIKNSCKFKNRR